MTLHRLPVRLAAGWTSAALVAVALAFVPLDRLPSFDVPKLVVLVLAACLLTLAAAKARGRGASDAALADPILAIPLAMSLAAGVGALVAWPVGSLVGPVTALACLALARIAASACDPAAAVRVFARGVAAAAALAGVYALLQCAGLDATPWAARRVPVATFGNASFAAEFQAAALPFAAFLALHADARRLDRVLGGAAALLGAVHLALATSRIDIAAAASGAAAGAVLILVARGRRRAAVAVTAACAVAALAAAAGFAALARGQGPAWLGRSDTVAVRSEIYASTAKLVGDAPLRAASAPFVDLYPAVRSAEEYRISMGRRVETPHDDYLEIAVALGVPGLVAALATLAILARRLVQAAPESPAEVAALGASCAALAVSALASSPLSHPSTALLGALSAGLVVALAPRPLRVPAFGARRADVAVAALLALAFVFGPVWRTLSSDGFLALGRARLAAGDATEALQVLDRAAATDPQAFDARYELGSLLRSASKHDAAIAALSSAHALRPGDLDCRVNLAYAYRDAGRRADADRLLDASLATCDWHPLLLAAKAIFAMEDGDDAAARDLAARAVTSLPGDPRLVALAAETRLARSSKGPGGESSAPEDHEACLDALLALFRDGETDELRRSARSMVRRDAGVLGPLATRARRIAPERPDEAAALVLAAAPAVTDDPGFLDEGSRVLAATGRAEESRVLLARSLGLRAESALAAGLASKAMKLAEQAAEREPTPRHFLTAARAAVRLGERDAAIECIGSAVACGDVDAARIANDPDLGRLAGDRRFADLLDRARRRSEIDPPPGGR